MFIGRQSSPDRRFSYPALAEIEEAPPTAELRPDEGNSEHSQLDEDDMGMSYTELSYFGRLRKLDRCGPVTMFKKLCAIWRDLEPQQVAEKVSARGGCNHIPHGLIAQFMTGQEILLLLRRESSQDDHAHTLLPR